MNSLALEIVIYLHTYLRTSFHCSGVKQLKCALRTGPPLKSHIAANGLVLTVLVVILNSIEASGPISKGSALKLYS